MKPLKALVILFTVLLLAVIGLVYILPRLQKRKSVNEEERRGGTEMVLKNYGNAIDSSARLFNIQSDYLKALCMLECSGRKIFDQRFEPHIYEKLKDVKFGVRNNFEHVTTEMLADANDDALRNLASSWGPFQLMGYKCLLMNIKVRDIRGEDAVFYGTLWINMSYGPYLKNKKFKDAFHIHNTGKPYPLLGRARTYDPDYCQKGLKYMDYFDKLISKTSP